MIAIKTSDLTQDFKRYADRIVQGETILISRPKNENLVVISEQIYNEINEHRRKANLAEFKKNLERSRAAAAANGTDKLTMDDINEIIAEERAKARREQAEG